MLALRKVTTNPIKLIPFLCRTYVQNSETLKKREKKMTTKQVHKEVMKYINPYAKIKIQSDIYLKVHAADVHRYPNADVLVAELHGAHAKNCNVELLVNTSDDEKEVDIQILKSSSGMLDFHCELAIPVKASVDIDGKSGACVEHLYSSDSISVRAEGSIKTRDIRSENISLKSGSGHINCAGTLLGKTTILETKSKGCILVDKLQGDELRCKTYAGDIHTNSCYVESSAFETDTGCLELKNVHKEAKVRINKPEGALHMTGVHGNIQVNTNGHTMKLQLSELQGDSSIIANNVKLAIINISNEIEQETELNVQAQSISLDHSLNHLATNLDDMKQNFIHNAAGEIVKKNCQSKLTVRNIQGNLLLGKQSWSEMMCKNIQSRRNVPFN